MAEGGDNIFFVNGSNMGKLEIRRPVRERKRNGAGLRGELAHSEEGSYIVQREVIGTVSNSSDRVRKKKERTRRKRWWVEVFLSYWGPEKGSEAKGKK